MTVAELIAILQKLPPEMRVVMEDVEYQDFEDIGVRTSKEVALSYEAFLSPDELTLDPDGALHVVIYDIEQYS